MLRQAVYDGLQCVVDENEETVVQLIEESGDTSQLLFLADTFVLNHEDVKRLVSHLDYWLIKHKLFRDEQKPTIDPSLADAEV